MRSVIDIGRGLIWTDTEQGDDWMSGHIELDDLSLSEAEGERDDTETIDVYIFDDEGEYPRWLLHSTHSTQAAADSMIVTLKGAGFDALTYDQLYDRDIYDYDSDEDEEDWG